MKITVGQALLILIDNYKSSLEISAELKKLYLSGAKDDFARKKIDHYLKDKCLKKYTISKEMNDINQDPSRRYFESHLALETIKKCTSGVNLKTLKGLYEIFCSTISPEQLEEALKVFKNNISTKIFNKIDKQYINTLKRIKEIKIFNEAEKEDGKKFLLSDVVESKKKIKLVVKLLYLALKIAETQLLPIPIYNKKEFSDTYRGKKMKGIGQSTHRSCHLGLMKSYMPLPEYDCLYTELGFDYPKSSDQARFSKEAPWVKDSFSKLVHPFSNSVSGTILAHLRVLKKLYDEEKKVFVENEDLIKYLRLIMAVMLYTTGGHSLYELTATLQVHDVLEAFKTDIDLRKIDLECLFFDGNTLAVNNSIGMAVEYNKQILKRNQVLTEISSVQQIDKAIKIKNILLDELGLKDIKYENNSYNLRAEINKIQKIITLISKKDIFDLLRNNPNLIFEEKIFPIEMVAKKVGVKGVVQFLYSINGYGTNSNPLVQAIENKSLKLTKIILSHSGEIYRKIDHYLLLNSIEFLIGNTKKNKDKMSIELVRVIVNYLSKKDDFLRDGLCWDKILINSLQMNDSEVLEGVMKILIDTDRVTEVISRVCYLYPGVLSSSTSGLSKINLNLILNILKSLNLSVRKLICVNLLKDSIFSGESKLFKKIFNSDVFCASSEISSGLFKKDIDYLLLETIKHGADEIFDCLINFYQRHSLGLEVHPGWNNALLSKQFFNKNIDNVTIAEKLIKMGLSVNDMDSQINLIESAIIHDKEECLRFLLCSFSNNPKYKQSLKWNKILSFSAVHKPLGIVEALLENGAPAIKNGRFITVDYLDRDTLEIKKVCLLDYFAHYIDLNTFHELLQFCTIKNQLLKKHHGIFIPVLTNALMSNPRVLNYMNVYELEKYGADITYQNEVTGDSFLSMVFRSSSDSALHNFVLNKHIKKKIKISEKCNISQLVSLSIKSKDLRVLKKTMQLTKFYEIESDQIQAACYHEFIEGLSYLFQYIKSNQSLDIICDEDWLDIFCIALENPNADILKLLFSHVPNKVDISEILEDFSSSSVEYSLDVLKVLHKNGLNLGRESLLQCAFDNANEEKIIYILQEWKKNRSQISIINNGIHLLDQVFKFKSPKVLKLMFGLLRISCVSNKYFSPLIKACSYGQPNLVYYILSSLQKKQLLKCVSQSEWDRALFFALKSGNIKTIQILRNFNLSIFNLIKPIQEFLLSATTMDLELFKFIEAKMMDSKLRGILSDNSILMSILSCCKNNEVVEHLLTKCISRNVQPLKLYQNKLISLAIQFKSVRILRLMLRFLGSSFTPGFVFDNLKEACQSEHLGVVKFVLLNLTHHKDFMFFWDKGFRFVLENDLVSVLKVFLSFAPKEISLSFYLLTDIELSIQSYKLMEDMGINPYFIDIQSRRCAIEFIMSKKNLKLKKYVIKKAIYQNIQLIPQVEERILFQSIQSGDLRLFKKTMGFVGFSIQGRKGMGFFSFICEVQHFSCEILKEVFNRLDRSSTFVRQYDKAMSESVSMLSANLILLKKFHLFERLIADLPCYIKLNIDSIIRSSVSADCFDGVLALYKRGFKFKTSPVVGYSALIETMMHSDIDALQALVNNGLELSKESLLGQNPLLKTKMSKILIENTPTPKFMNKLIELGFDINFESVFFQFNCSILYQALYLKKMDLALNLLRWGANPNLGCATVNGVLVESSIQLAQRSDLEQFVSALFQDPLRSGLPRVQSAATNLNKLKKIP